MEKCSYFIQEKALFGSFPSREIVESLEEIGIRHFINLTSKNESKIVPYSTKYNYINYPIADRKIPHNWKTFAQLILRICNIINNLQDNEKIYIHCKGGHGRSGILVACILCYLHKLKPDEALELTNKFHSNRKCMKDKWRKLGSPQDKRQKDFVRNFFKPIKINSMYGLTAGFHNFSPLSVYIPSIGTFYNAHAALQYQCKENCLEEEKVNCMYDILKYKFLQHEKIYKVLISSGLGPIIKISTDRFWGENGDGIGKNIYGKLLDKLRDKFLTEDI